MGNDSKSRGALNMIDFKHCSEGYVVAKTVDVVVTMKGEGPARIRIEAVENAHGTDVGSKFSTLAYREEMVTVQPTHPQTGNNFDRQPEEMRIWVSYDLPWTDRDTADGAIQQALGFLRQRCD
jgi:hypothetical protein